MNSSPIVNAINCYIWFFLFEMVIIIIEQFAAHKMFKVSAANQIEAEIHKMIHWIATISSRIKW